MTKAGDGRETVLREGRLSRWSRLKRDADKGAGAGEEAPDKASAVTPTQGVTPEDTYGIPDPHAMPGGSAARRGSLVPAMRSLVGEDDGPAPVTEAEAAAEAFAVETGVEGDAPAIRELTEEEAAVVAELPPIESLSKDSDFTPFLADKVPEFIRHRALQVLWRSDPVLANLDGLNDYDLNYRIIDTLIDAAKDTIYRIGKGHGSDEEDAAEAEAQAEAEAKAKAQAEAQAETQPQAGQQDAAELRTGAAEQKTEQAVDEASESGEGTPKTEAAGMAERPSAGSVRKPDGAS